jgi:hypothetical protein
LMGKPEGRGPLGRPRSRWVENIKMDLRELWWHVIDWIDLVQDRGQWRKHITSPLQRPTG